MPTIRVDGNDLLAVYAATAAARAIGTEQGRPTLVEAMTYRVGAHSTSDDDSKYREPSAPEEGWDDERSYWEARSPIVRFGRYLHQRGCFSGADEERMRRALRKEAIAALSAAEEAGRPSPHHLFTDVWDVEPPALQQQRAALQEHMARHPAAYDKFPSFSSQ
mmetsp:Transcript_16238/g.52894  ORF Transcript_16238/g.52894 Transcript_16238/m.52894 type:complete len:163 (+) Transcript_16238:108-596(+)